ncbi:uncharacterized protein LOC124302645 [Neodiprion virginianus]|uniref:uncharacterized protein LOC124302645 n=1 Tax=Neodiprion virginianus TaxID=2961670 RepID=UPI001EE73717|nr:uncharacterized protein LOC124302645 [Neodiprion virginianus]
MRAPRCFIILLVSLCNIDDNCFCFGENITVQSPDHSGSQAVNGSGSVSETQHATCQITTEELVASAQATVTRVLTGACIAEAVDQRLQSLENLFQIGIDEINQKLNILLRSSSSRLRSLGDAGRLDVDPRQAEVDRMNNTISEISTAQATIRAFTHFLRVEHFDDKMSQWGSRGYLRSPNVQVGPRGYAMYLKVIPRDVQGDKVFVSVGAGLTRGEYDASLTWPFALKYRVEILDHSEEGYRHDLSGATFDPLDYRHYAGLWKRPITTLGNDDNIALVNIKIPANIILDSVNRRSDYFSSSDNGNRKYLWQGSLLIKLTVYL